MSRRASGDKRSGNNCQLHKLLAGQVVSWATVHHPITGHIGFRTLFCFSLHHVPRSKRIPGSDRVLDKNEDYISRASVIHSVCHCSLFHVDSRTFSLSDRQSLGNERDCLWTEVTQPGFHRHEARINTNTSLWGCPGEPFGCSWCLEKGQVPYEWENLTFSCELLLRLSPPSFRHILWFTRPGTAIEDQIRFRACALAAISPGGCCCRQWA